MSENNGKHPGSPNEWTDLSFEHFKLGGYNEALNEAEKAIELDSGYTAAWIMKGRVLNALNRPEEGLAALDQAIECDQKSFDSYYYKSFILDGQERFQEALTELDHALRINSTSMDALALKCGVLIKLKGEEAPVLPVCNRMIQLDPNDSRGWDNKAFFLLMQKEYGEAEKVIDHSLALPSGDKNSRALFLKATVCDVTGRQRQSRKFLKLAAELNPQDEFIQDIKSQAGASTYDESHKPTVDQAKTSIILCWVFTLAVGLMFFATLPILSFYVAWSLYWGWAPMWWRWSPFGDTGSAFKGMNRDAEKSAIIGAINTGRYSREDEWAQSLFSKLVYLVFMGVFLLLAAIIYGAFKGISRYQFYRHIAGKNAVSILSPKNEAAIIARRDAVFSFISKNKVSVFAGGSIAIIALIVVIVESSNMSGYRQVPPPTKPAVVTSIPTPPSPPQYSGTTNPLTALDEVVAKNFRPPTPPKPEQQAAPPTQPLATQSSGTPNLASPAKPVNPPALKVGDTYVFESMDPDHPESGTLVTRRTITSKDHGIVFTVVNLKNTKAKARNLYFNGEWNLLSTRNADSSGSDYSPPVKYFEFPLYPGKTWQETTTETDIKTRATKILKISGTVGQWEDVSVPAGTFHAIKVVLQTELFDPVTTERVHGTDTSWYVPEVRRSVKSLTSGREGKRQLFQLIQYELK